MSRFLPLLLLALSGTALSHALTDNPAGSFPLDWSNEQVRRTFATGVFNTLGIRVDNDPSVAAVSEIDGRPVVSGIALTFDVDDEFAFDVDETIRVEVEIDPGELDSVFIAYDRNGSPDGRIALDMPAGDGFRTVSAELPRARFANRGFAGTDFAISSGIDMASDVIAVRNIRFTRSGSSRLVGPSGRLDLRVTDEDGHPLTVQVGLYDESGRMPLPGDLAVELQVFDQFTRSVEVREELDNLAWPHSNRYSFYVDGVYTAQVPAGKYELVIVKGPEFPIERRVLTIDAGEHTTLSVVLPHTLDMPSRGWYSGDVHNHFSRPNASWNSGHMVHAKAHDVHMHWLHELGNSVATHFQQFAWGDAGVYQDGDYLLGSGQEDPRTDYLGHVLSMGQSDRARRPDDYLRYDLAVNEVHAKGGIAGIAHMDFAQFWQDVALALLASEGLVDFVEVMQYNTVNTRDWYRFLNMGFRLPAAAGSDWPYMSLPGTVRTYVHVDGELTPDKWNEGLQAGRSFVSNGPMLEFTVNGQPIGAVVDVAAGDMLEVAGTARMEPSWDELVAIELIHNGEVIETVTSDGAGSLKLSTSVAAGEGGWFALRAVGRKRRDIVFQTPFTMQTQAHSSAVYISVDGGPSAEPKVAAENMRKVIERLEWFKTAKYARNDNEAWESPDRTEALVDEMRPAVHEWVDAGIRWYQAKATALEELGND